MNFFGLTDKGKLRRQNQDFLFASDVPVGGLPNLFVVADGMGGHNAGEVASEYAVDELLERLRATDDPEPVHAISDAVSYANAKVYEKAGEDIDKAGMGTTMVTCVLSGKHLSVSNVGDSRLYCLDRTSIRQITRDHSVVEELIRRGALSEEDAEFHKDRHKITRAVGAEPEVRTDFFDLDFSGRTFRLLASPFQKACFAMAHAEPDQVPDVVRALRKAYPGLTQVISPRVRSGRKTVSDYGTLPKEDRQVFQGFLEAMGISPEKFILDPACLVVIDGPEDILGDMIRNGLFDIDGVETLENLHDPELMEKYVTD